MNKLNVAVIGLGVMGQTHTRLYAEMADVELVGVFDINAAHAQMTAAKYGVPAAESLEALFANPSLDAVSICTSDDQHYELAMLACKHGKHVLMEKPLATDLAEAEAIVREAEKAGITLLVGHTLRWDPRYYHARMAVEAGQIGAPLHLYARRNNSYQNGLRLKGRTSVLMFLGVHDIDAIEWVTGDRITEVYTVEVRKRLTEFDVGDAAVTTFKFASGAVGSYETSWVMPDRYLELDAKLDIIGTAGAVNVDIVNQNITVHSDTRFIFPDTMYGVEMYGRLTGIMKEELTSFVLAARGLEPLPITAREAYRAVYIASCMEKSLQTGLPVAVKG
ncbi:Gfo/Idh/MocA family protein [Paenibacillus jiagnxiensis]|uniref:Gfo/Idh/MocA family protein n=1 Tax=Paenibacillus jiagnxiensis TaxID=3228926 RepID=UPI0033B3829D